MLASLIYPILKRKCQLLLVIKWAHPASVKVGDIRIPVGCFQYVYTSYTLVLISVPKPFGFMTKPFSFCVDTGQESRWIILSKGEASSPVHWLNCPFGAWLFTGPIKDRFITTCWFSRLLCRAVVHYPLYNVITHINVSFVPRLCVHNVWISIVVVKSWRCCYNVLREKAQYLIVVKSCGYLWHTWSWLDHDIIVWDCHSCLMVYDLVHYGVPNIKVSLVELN